MKLLILESSPSGAGQLQAFFRGLEDVTLLSAASPEEAAAMAAGGAADALLTSLEAGGLPLLQRDRAVLLADFLRKLYLGSAPFSPEEAGRLGFPADGAQGWRLLNAGFRSGRETGQESARREAAFEAILLESLLGDPDSPCRITHRIDDLHMVTLFLPGDGIPAQELRRRAGLAARRVREELASDTYMAATRDCFVPDRFQEAKVLLDRVFPYAAIHPGRLHFDDAAVRKAGEAVIDEERVIDAVLRGDRSALVIYTRSLLKDMDESADASSLRLLRSQFQRAFHRCLEELDIPLALIRRDPDLALIEQAAERTPADLTAYVDHMAARIMAAGQDLRRSGTRMERIRTYIREHCREDITREQLCARFHISPGYLSRLFASQSDRSLRAYVNHCRISEALRLMGSTGLSIGEIAAEVGYENPQYFSYAFRRELGVTPREWRAEGTGEPGGQEDSYHTSDM